MTQAPETPQTPLDTAALVSQIASMGGAVRLVRLPASGETCATCRFGQPAGDRVLCRRYPPVVIESEYVPRTSGGGSLACRDARPRMHPDDWCGEHDA